MPSRPAPGAGDGGKETPVNKILSDEGLDLLFRQARTHSHWLEGEIVDVLLEAIYDLAKMGPTSANCSPMRVVFVRSPEAKERLRPALDAGNVDKTMTAPVTAIVAYDTGFYEHLPRLFPHADARAWFAGNEALIQETAMRNGTLQGAYFIIAARALGLDCGPMSGFDKEAVDRAFFRDRRVKSNFLCNLAHGDADKLPPRGPRLDFAEACQVV